MAVLFFALFVFATLATTPWHSGLRLWPRPHGSKTTPSPATPPAPAVGTAQRQVTEVTIPIDIVHELIHHLKRLEAYDRREQIRVVVRQSRLGAATQQMLASVVHTARLRGLDTRSVLVDLLRARHPIVSSALTATPQ